MSGWERSRYIPWERIPTKTGSLSNEFDLDSTKERIFRELQKEAIEKESQRDLAATKASADVSSSMNDTTTTTNTIASDKVIRPYSHMDLARQAAFGVTLGSITGTLFGFMDGMKHLNENTILQKTSNPAKFKFLLQGTTRSGLLFAVFFSSYQCCKYGTRILLSDPGDVTEIGLAAPISLGMFYSQPQYRPAMPYAFMLVGMDCFSTYMRKTS